MITPSWDRMANSRNLPPCSSPSLRLLLDVCELIQAENIIKDARCILIKHAADLLGFSGDGEMGEFCHEGFASEEGAAMNCFQMPKGSQICSMSGRISWCCSCRMSRR